MSIMLRFIFLSLTVLVSASSAGLFTLDSDVVLERQLNRMWAVFGTAETGVVPSQGNEAGWAEWNALKFAQNQPQTATQLGGGLLCALRHFTGYSGGMPQR